MENIDTTQYPQPESKRVLLRSEGYIRETITAHHYVETRLCELPGDGTAYEFIFECFKTGTRRRFGTQRLATDAAPEVGPDPETN